MSRTARNRSLARRASAAAAALALSLTAAASASAASVRPDATPLFSTPSAIAAVGPWIVVANQGPSTLTVLTASDGAVVGHVSHVELGVTKPTSMVAEVVGGRRIVFVAGTGGRVAELALTSSGAAVTATLLRTLRPSGCAKKAAAYLTTDPKGHVIEACGNGVVTEWRASMGTVVRSIPASRTKVTNATGIAAIGSDVAITSAGPDAVTQLAMTSGSRLRTVSNAANAAYAFSTPGAISSDGVDYWVINTKGNTVDELSGPTLRFLGSSGTNLTAPGTVLATPTYVWVSSSSVAGSSSMVTQFQVVDHALQSPWMMCNSNGPYKFGNPSGFALSGSSLWVANAADNLVDQMNASSGALVATYT